MNEKEQRTPEVGNSNQPVIFNSQELEVYELLREHSTESRQFHEWYRSALETLNSNTTDKISQAAHSIRELCDRLPTKLGIPVFTSPVAFLKPLQNDFLTIKKNRYPNGWHGKTIDNALGEALAKIEEVFRLVNEPARKDRLKLALTSPDVFSSVLSKSQLKRRDSAFKRVGDFFQDAAHHNDFVDETTFREVLETFEILLLNYLKPCTASQHLELLALIKQGPSADNKQKLKQLIDFKAANFLFFFQKLDNPAWLDFLEEEGKFSDLPGPQPTEDGSFRYDLHIPLMCLPQISKTAPEAATKILVRLVIPDNPRVGDQILQCMAGFANRDCIRRLSPLIEQLRNSLGRTSWLWIEELLQNWFKAEAYQEGFEIAQLFLFASVDASTREGVGADSWLARQVADKVLTPLTEKFPHENAVLLFKALQRWAERIRSRYNETDASAEEPSTYWLDDFKAPSQTHRQLESLLASRLYAASSNIYKTAATAGIEKLEKLIRSDSWSLFRRLRWQLYADFPQTTLKNAREEVLPRIPVLMRIENIHDYEFANLLESHAETHGELFLSPTEVGAFVDSILSGPLDENGNNVQGYDKGLFWRKQLQPILRLLTETQRRTLEATSSGAKPLKQESYKPYSPGVMSFEVVTIAPPEAETMEQLDDDSLWNFLNTWEPMEERPREGKRVREDIHALAGKFAELVVRRPDRFTPSAQWWKRAKRPVMLYRVLERATDHFVQKQHDEANTMPPPSDCDWETWFGIIRWIFESKTASERKTTDSQPPGPDWGYGWNSVSRLLRMILRSNYPIPESRLTHLREILEYLIKADNDEWEESARPNMGDWYATAINSERGNTIEALLYFGLRQKDQSNQVEPWLFDLIKYCLLRPKESPATFSLLGVNLPLAAYLFGNDLKSCPDLLLPPGRPVQRNAAVISHFRYGRPDKLVLGVFPNLPDIALGILKSEANAVRDTNQNQEWRDFGSRLGTHLTFYFWNEAFASQEIGQKTLDNYFATASESARKGLIHHIGQAFRNADDTVDKGIVKRTMSIWERRISHIKAALNVKGTPKGNFDSELSELPDWLDCECFPLDWRIEKAGQAIALLSKAPHAYRLTQTLVRFGATPELLGAGIKLLHAILTKPSDELRWSIQYKEIGPLVSAGLKSENELIKRLARECLDKLLLLGCTDFMQLAPDRSTKAEGE